MSKVEIISITKSEKPEFKGLSPEELIIAIARVSNQKNELNTATAPKLLKFCILNNHWSIFEQVDICFKIRTSRAIAAQILRHYSANFQELCISGDSLIYFDSPKSVKNGKRLIYKKKISDLYKSWNNSDHKKNNIKKMYVRCYDEKSKTLSHAHIKNIFRTGLKPVFEIELYNGKKIKCTKEHKFLTPNGFMSLEHGAGLSLYKNKATISNKDFAIGCNGILNYKSKDWLLESKKRNIANGKGLSGIAEEAGVSYHTIKKWLKINNLCFIKKEVANYVTPWNKGKFGYKNKPHSIDAIKKMKQKARKGSDSNLWKGGSNRTERLKIADWCNSIRAEKLIEYNYKCCRCGSSKKLELDHIYPVYSNPELAYYRSNIQVLCKKCNCEKHKINGDYKTWSQNKTKTNNFVVEWSKIKSVKYIGEEMTYDMEIDHDSHNYVANGIVTHNSQRYTTVPDIEPIELRYQGKSNRQVGEELLDNNNPLYNVVTTEIDNLQRAYNKLIDGGVAKEVARMIMPLSSSTDLYMKNNVRNWLAYFNVRLHKHCQKEHRDIAWQILEIFKIYFPEITKVFHNYEFALNHHMFDTLVLEKYLGETKMREILTQREEK